MTPEEWSLYFDKSCRFRMKNGREVFGVIREEGTALGKQYFFVSASEHKRLLEESNLPRPTARNSGHPVDLDEIILAERIGF